MAQKRVQVRELEASTLVNPVARPVETYVRPAQAQVAPSPLTQFVNSIAPAVKASEDAKLTERLKREREEEKLRIQAKYKQGELAMGQLISRVDNAYSAAVAAKDDTWHTLSTEQVTDQINKFADDYFATLPADTDPLLIKSMRMQLDEGMVKFITKWDAGKQAYNINVGNADFAESISTILRSEQPVDEQILAIQGLINTTAEANPFADGKANYKRYLDVAVDYLHDMGELYADNALYAALETMTGKDGQPLNVLDTRERIKKGSTIRKRVAKLRQDATAAANKAEVLSNALTNVFEMESGAPLEGLSYINKSGTLTKFTEDELEEAVLSSPEFAAMGKGEKYDFLNRINLTPKRYKAQVKDTLPMLEAGVLDDTPELNNRIMGGLNQYLAMKNSGMDMSFLKDEERIRFEAMAYLVQGSGRVGQREVLLTDGLQDDPTIPDSQMVTDYINAARLVQKITPTPMTEEFKKEVLDELDGGIFTDVFTTDLAEVYNGEEVIRQVAKDAHYLYMTGGFESIEEAAKAAAAIAKEDYPVVTSSDGTSYAFHLLNTDIDQSLNAQVTISEYNKLLPNMESVQQAIFAQHGLKEGEFVVALLPDRSNPNAIGMFVWNTTTKPAFPIGFVGGKLDKKTLLTDKDQLNNLVAIDVSGQQLSSVEAGSTITPPVGSMTPAQNDIETALQEAEAAGMNVATIGNLELRTGGVGIGDIVSDALGGQVSPEEVNQVVEQGVQAATDAGITAEDVETISQGNLPDMTEFISNLRNAVGDIDISPIGQAAASTLIEDEGFRSAPYDDMGLDSVGYGFQIESLEPDERALIEDINDVQPEEADAVLGLKVSKLENWWNNTIDGFSNLPESSQVAAINMSYQLGKENVAREWTKFMGAVGEAAQYAQGSAEQAAALAEAKFHMLYNVAEDGLVTATKWSTQTADRAMRVAEGMAAEAGEVLSETGTVIADNLEAAGASIVNAIIPEASASELQPAIVGEKPEAQAVAAIAGAKNPADVAATYLGMDENTAEGAAAVKGFFENVVGDWNPDNQSVQEFATSKAWCAAFLTQVLRDSGVDTKALLGTDKFNQVRAAAYLKAGDAVDAGQVKAGDIMIKMHSAEDRKKFKLGVAHVGIVASVDGDTVYFIGGNTGDKVELSDYSMSQEDVRFRRISGVTDLPTESLPSMLSLKAGKYGRKAMDKISNGFNSLYDSIFG